MIDFIQSFMLALGNYGCYVFCILNIADEYLKRRLSWNEIMEYIMKGIEKGYIEFHKDNYDHKDNFYVENPAMFLSMIVNKKCSVRKEKANYNAKSGEFLVERWVNGKYAHFARTNKNFNSLQVSQCVNKGDIESYRVFTIEK